MSDITPSSIKADKVLEEKIRNADFEQVKEIMHNAAVEQGVAYRDWDPSILKPCEPAPVPNGYAKTVVINGVKTILEGRTEQELLAAENAFYRAQFSQPATTQPVEQPRGSDGRFASADDAAAKAELELQFKRGDIDVSTYLERSGAIDHYLEKAGIPLDELRATVQEKQTERAAESWAQATKEFLAGPGLDWPGGEENLAIARQLLQENGLAGQPSAETLASVWTHMKENGLAVPNKTVEQARRIALAQSPSELAAILEIPQRQKLITESGLFGR